MKHWKSPLSASSVKLYMMPSTEFTCKEPSPCHLSVSLPGKKRAFPSSPSSTNVKAKKNTQKLEKNTHNSKKWTDKRVREEEAGQWQRTTLPRTRLEVLDADAGAHNTLKSANPYPFGMLLLCEGVGREPPLQRFEQGGVETGGIKAGSQTGVYGGCGGGWEKKGSLLRDSSGMWLTRPGQARHLGSELHKGLGSSDHPHKEKKKACR